jgi:cyanophycin synthetase
LFFSERPDAPVLADHLRRNGRALYLRQGWLTLARGSEETRIGELAAIPYADAASLVSILAAAGAACVLGLAPELIRAGIETFDITPAPTVTVANNIAA